MKLGRIISFFLEGKSILNFFLKKKGNHELNIYLCIIRKLKQESLKDKSGAP